MITSINEFKKINEETHENVGDQSWDYFLCDDGGCSTEWNIPFKLNKGTSFTHSFGHFKVTSYKDERIIMCDKIGNLTKESIVKEGISAHSFTSGLVSEMQKCLPKNRWTVSYDHGEITVTNDFEETATFRLESFKSNEGEFRQPNIPTRGSAEEKTWSTALNHEKPLK